MQHVFHGVTKVPEVLGGGELTLEGAETRLAVGDGRREGSSMPKELEKGGQRGGKETIPSATESAFAGAPRTIAGSFFDFAGVLAPD